eukprot:2020504-Prorocentrum_lima.AAC.1
MANRWATFASKMLFRAAQKRGRPIVGFFFHGIVTSRRGQLVCFRCLCCTFEGCTVAANAHPGKGQ